MEQIKNKLSTHFSIAEFVIEVQVPTPFRLIIDEGLSPFQIPPHQNPDLRMNYAGALADFDNAGCSLKYQAKDEGQLLWQIFQQETNWLYYCYDPKNEEKLQQIAVLDQTKQNWQVYCDESSPLKIDALAYPLLPLMLYELTTFKNALMIHASAVMFNHNGLLFSGVSGVGKSTLASIFEEQGAKIINDDRVIIRKKNTEFEVFNTPMYYAAEPVSCKLSTIFFPTHATENSAIQIQGANAIGQLMANTIHHAHNPGDVVHLLEVAEEICARIPLFHLGVVPTAEIVTFIQELHEE